jgi:hypothetical protein
MIKYLQTIHLALIISLGIIFLGCGDISNKREFGASSLEKLTYHSSNSPIIINEILSANANTNYDPDFKEFSDWIELYNDSNETIDISRYYLSDKEDNPTKWQIPANTSIQPYSYLLIWADGEDTKQQALHSNFKLSQKGESISLYDRDKILIDSIEYGAQEGDISCAKSDSKIIYMKPSPNAKNNPAHQQLIHSEKPTFLLKSGFYEGSQLVELEAEGDIYYTLDGSHPTQASQPYNAPIMIDKTTVIRAISIEAEKFPSQAYSQTYLIDEDISLPVMSLSMDEKYLYDDEIGIYTNFNEDWMRAGNVEFIKDGESKFSENIGIRLHGASSRQLPQKSFAVFFKNKYGKRSLNHSLFIDKPKVKMVKSFILRNTGNDWAFAMMRDTLTHALAKEIGNINYLSSEYIITFVNGEYYGLLNLREKPNKDYIKINNNISTKDIDIISTGIQDIAIDGNLVEYHNLINFIKTNSLKEDENYQFVASKVDIDNFINYNILQQYIGNVDWPQNNIKSWKEKTTNAQWSWILYDTDFGFGLYKNLDVPLRSDYTKDTFERLYHKVLDNHSEVILYRNLQKNSIFNMKYKQKYLNLLNTIFLPNQINNKITLLKNKIAPEISRHLKKWFDDERTYKDWEDSVDELYEFANKRNNIVQGQLKKGVF